MSDKKKVAFGLTLPNRGVITGATTVAEMLEMAEWAEALAQHPKNPPH